MSRPIVLAAVLLSTASVVACSAASEDDVGGAHAAQRTRDPNKSATTPYARSLDVPTPDSEDNALAVPQVVRAMKAIRKAFYEDGSGYYQSSTPGAARVTVPDASEPASCVQVCPPFWSDVMCHYYCALPSYSSVTPNIRECFSEVVRGYQAVTEPAAAGEVVKHPSNRPFYYPEVYDYCAYQKPLLGGFPQYSEDEIEKNKTDANPIGPLGWIHRQQEQHDVWKAIMYAWYNPFTYRNDHQQDAINEFYGVQLKNKGYGPNDAEDVKECQDKRPMRQGDPQDGTHCSFEKQLALGKHPQAPVFKTYMEELLGRTN